MSGSVDYANYGNYGNYGNVVDRLADAIKELNEPRAAVAPVAVAPVAAERIAARAIDLRRGAALSAEPNEISIDVTKDVLAQIGQPPGATAKALAEAATTIDLAPLGAKKT